MPTKSRRLSNLPPYVFSVIGDRISKMQAEGIDVYRFDIGSPDLPPPSAVVESLAATAAEPNVHDYSGYRGVRSFRVAIANHYKARFGVELNPDTQVLPLIGSKEGLVNLALAYVSEGDISLVPDIGYPAYAMGTRLAEGEVYWVPMPEELRFLADVTQVPQDVADRAKVFWVNYPNNPTGVTAGIEFYQQALAFCQQHDILLVSDNPYMDVLFDGKQAVSALQAAQDTEYNNLLEFYSFSKSYNMAGWRLGAAVGSADAIKNLLQVKSNVDSGHFKPIYEAGITALQTPQSWIDQRNAVYQKRRDWVLQALPEIGLSTQPSDGTLYVWAKVANGISVSEYVEQALINAHVSIAPGGAYGPGGENYVRISIAVQEQRLQQGLEKLKSWYASL
ncbi:MAG: LL-diaminopimelate aminotransferase [Anaerolineae bacterium]